MIYCFRTLIGPYLGKFFAGSSGFLIESMLFLYITATLMVAVNIIVSVTINLEVNMKTIIRTVSVVGGAAFLGRMAQFLNATRDALG